MRSVAIPKKLDLAGACRDLLSDLDKRLDRIRGGKASKEDVHKFRTGCRRLEAVLTHVLHAHKSSEKVDVYRRTKWARKKAGNVRDMDVARELVETVAAPLDCDSQAACRFLDGYLKTRRKRAMAKLELGAGEQEFRGLQSDLKNAFDGHCLTSEDVKSVLLACMAECRRLAAKRQTPEALHHTRLSLKRVRDVATVVGSAAGRKARTIASKAAKLSDQLGKSHDLVMLIDVIDEAARKGKPPRELKELRRRLKRRHERMHARARRGIAGIHVISGLVERL